MSARFAATPGRSALPPLAHCRCSSPSPGCATAPPLVLDATARRDPFRLLLASNYLPPFYTHPPALDGERYGDAGLSDGLPYEALFAHGCDAVVLIAVKGESEGGLCRGPEDFDHQIAPDLFPHVVVIRPAPPVAARLRRATLEAARADRRPRRAAGTRGVAR
jgi:predicted acylesterase/phospholipase RssA